MGTLRAASRIGFSAWRSLIPRRDEYVPPKGKANLLPGSPKWNRGWPVIACAFAFAILAASVVAAHLIAHAEYSRSFDSPASIEVRAHAAAIAASVEPWNRGFVARAHLLTLWVEGKDLLEAGDYNAAVDVLDSAYRQDVGNVELLALYQQAQAVQAEETNRKAHLQHGHEGPGGTLLPEDVER
ncbi:MAG: tetratricopeptide repeat protein [Coriobacteriia bacterium]|nr:tetratricopeptide repeat protein [Coriobacteriia bacterium]